MLFLGFLIEFFQRQVYPSLLRYFRCLKIAFMQAVARFCFDIWIFQSWPSPFPIESCHFHKRTMRWGVFLLSFCIRSTSSFYQMEVEQFQPTQYDNDVRLVEEKNGFLEISTEKFLLLESWKFIATTWKKHCGLIKLHTFCGSSEILETRKTKNSAAVHS